MVSMFHSAKISFACISQGDFHLDFLLKFRFIRQGKYLQHFPTRSFWQQCTIFRSVKGRILEPVEYRFEGRIVILILKNLNKLLIVPSYSNRFRIYLSIEDFEVIYKFVFL